MSARLHDIVKVRMPVLLLAFAGSVAPPATILAQSLIPPEEAHRQRELRSIERRAVTDPDGAARAAGEAQRRLVRDADGVAFSPEEARADRRLQRLRGAEREEARVALEVPAVGDPLPATYEDAYDPLPSMRDPLLRAGSLLDRAEIGIADGNVASARSDLSLAARELATVSAATAERVAAVTAARERLASLSGQLAK